MKNRIQIKHLFIILGCMLLLASSCKKQWEAELSGDTPRLFRPVLKSLSSPVGNYLDIAWQKSKETNKYRVDLSIDSFKTVANTIEVVDTSAVSIQDLLWEQLYQIRVTALHPTEPAKDSRPADFGAMKTPRFPTIVVSPSSSDVGWTNILFKWRNEGDPVTSVRVINSLTSAVVSTIILSATNITNAYLLIGGLQASTAYRVELYSGTRFRGSNTYTTKESLAGVIVDLQNIDPTTVNLSSVLDTISSGGTIILKRGGTYEPSTALNLSKSLTIMSGIDPLVPGKARLGMVGISNFGFVANSNIAKLAFVDLDLYSNDAGAKYLFNPNGGSINIDELRFENCTIHDFRGIARFRGAFVIGQFTIENSFINNVGGYGVITVDDATAVVNNFTVNNSTLFNVEKLLVNKNNSNGKVVISNSTLYATVLAGAYLIDYNGTALYPKGGIEFTNVVLGRAKGSTATPPAYDIFGFRVNAATIVTSSNNYVTSDFAWRTSSSVINPTATVYTKTSADIFTSPDTGNFLIKDNGFPGKETAGDPRWKP